MMMEGLSSLSNGPASQLMLPPECRGCGDRDRKAVNGLIPNGAEVHVLHVGVCMYGMLVHV